MKSYCIAVVLVMLAADIAAAGSSMVDFDRRADFCKYKTFAWQQGMPAPNPKTEQWIRDAVSARLKAGGILPGTTDGDLYVVTYVRVNDQQVMNVKRIAYAGWQGTSVSVGPGKAGSLVVDLVDPSTKRLIWRAVAQKTFSRRSPVTQDLINQKIGILFKYFPPGGCDSTPSNGSGNATTDPFGL